MLTNRPFTVVFAIFSQYNYYKGCKNQFLFYFCKRSMKTKTHLFNKAQRIVAAKICFFVFITKMLISATPMFVNVLDKGTILQVVLQLEIELGTNSNANNEDLHEHGVKIFKPDAIKYIGFNPTVENNGKSIGYEKNEKSICHFHPEVPTPPPNC